MGLSILCTIVILIFTGPILVFGDCDDSNQKFVEICTGLNVPVASPVAAQLAFRGKAVSLYGLTVLESPCLSEFL